MVEKKKNGQEGELRRKERERERDDGNGISVLQLLVLEGASYRLTNGLSLLTLMERVMKNNKLCHEYGHVHACNGSILYLRL